MAFGILINSALFIKINPYKFDDLHMQTRKKCIYKPKLML